MQFNLNFVEHNMSDCEESCQNPSTENVDNVELNKKVNAVNKEKKSDTTTQDKRNITNADKQQNEESCELKSGEKLTVSERPRKVSFHSDSDNSVQKFIEGDVIVDKQNPFKNEDSLDAPSTKTAVAKPRKGIIRNPSKANSDDEFVTTEQVLRESKFVTTYIKNPDKVFKYDPIVAAQIRLEELKDMQGRKPVRKKGLTKQTHDRLNDVKNKNLLNNIHSQLKTAEPRIRRSASNESKIPKFKKVSKSGYPDLSQIKVKTGTDLDESFEFDPEEVALNAKRFDDRVKSLKINSEDEIEDIEDPLTSVEDNQSAGTIDATFAAADKKSFSNTVNSTEFKEFLKRKGLVLTPKNVIYKSNVTPIEEVKESTVNNTIPTENMSLKKDKKQSVLRRILNPSLFSSKRKTVPKDPVPQAQSLYSNASNLPVVKSDMKRIVLQRQSFPRNASSADARSNQFKIPVGQAHRNYETDDMSSSISSTLTNAEHLSDLPDSSQQYENLDNLAQREKRPNQIHSREQSNKISLNRSSLNNPSRIMLSSSRGHGETRPVPTTRTSLIRNKPTDENRNPKKTSTVDRHEVPNRRENILKSSQNSSEWEPSQVKSIKGSFSAKNVKTLQDARLPVFIQERNIGIQRTIRTVDDTTNNMNQTKTSLADLRNWTDAELYLRASTPQQPQPETKTFNQKECIYETLPNGQSAAARSKVVNFSNVALNSNFVRGGSQRSTYSGVPSYSQSVIDVSQHSQQSPRGVRNSFVTGSMSKEEILNRVRDFCRRSINETSGKTDELPQKYESEVPPLPSSSYQRRSSLQTSAPQVPQRTYSLDRHAVPYQIPHPTTIDAHPGKRDSLQSNSSNVYSSPIKMGPNVVQRSVPGASSQHLGVYPLNRSQNPSYAYNSGSGRTTPLILMEPRMNSTEIHPNMARQQLLRSYIAPQSVPISRNVNRDLYAQVLSKANRPASALANVNPYSFRRQAHIYESESGSEAGEVQRIMQENDEDWQNDKSGRNPSNDQVADDRRRANRREDPRRHTLGTDMLQYGNQAQTLQRAMDLEMGTRTQKNKKVPPIRGYAPINQGPLFDEDPGIMSEVETASTGFRRGGKQRSSLPVVRTPSKTLERPLGLVFLQYRSETKRALLPNEITSIDTVRALFVRSFPRQLTMAYLEGPNVKIYIHDASKDMFYELEDVRSHLREIRDRSVLRLFESNEVAAPQVLPGGPGVPQPLPQTTGGHWDQDQSYFSEPEFDSEYQHQHIHKSKGVKPAPYYVAATQTLPRGMYSDRKAAIGAPVKPLRSYSSSGSMVPPIPYSLDQLYNVPDGYTSSPERGTRSSYEEPYYSQYGTRGGSVNPIIDEEQRCDGNLTDDQYSLYGMKIPARLPRSTNQLYDPTRPEDLHRIRVEHMERQLANLTGLVQKALNQNPQLVVPPGVINSNYLGVLGQGRVGIDDVDGHSSGSSTSIQDKSVSFEKSVSFSDDIHGVPKSHIPQHPADTKPPKPAIKSSTLPRTSSQERDRLKPPPPPKPIALASTHPNYRPDIALAPEVYNHLRGLQKKAKDLRMEVRTLRRLSQAQAIAVREDIKDTFMRIRATLLVSSNSYWGQGDQERTRLTREEEVYKQEVIRLEKDLSDLETSVEGLRGEVINRRTRVNMAAVEDMALVLSRASKTVAELKMKFPGLQQGLRNILASEMDNVVREEKFLKDEPDRLESALRRCKKLTGTLVTLKRLASVQEQRLPAVDPVNEEQPRSAEFSTTNKPIPSPRMGTVTIGGGVAPETALDALLDELQTFAKPQNQDARPDDSTSDDSSQTLHNTVTTQHSQSNLFPNDPNTPQINTGVSASNVPTNRGLVGTPGNLRRLHSYPSGSDTDTSPPQPSRPIGKPPVPERNADLLSKVGNKRIPPPPPPRTSSRSPLASPTSPNVPQRLPSVCESDQMGNGSSSGQEENSSGNESGNDHVQKQLALELRHQELLKKQKLLQEQYARLQQMSKNSIALPPADALQLKKTGSESNLPQKMGLNMTATGSMKNLNAEINIFDRNEKNLNMSSNANNNNSNSNASSTLPATSTTNKVYETDIL